MHRQCAHVKQINMCVGGHLFREIVVHAYTWPASPKAFLSFFPAVTVLPSLLSPFLACKVYTKNSLMVDLLPILGVFVGSFLVEASQGALNSLLQRPIWRWSMTCLYLPASVRCFFHSSCGKKNRRHCTNTTMDTKQTWFNDGRSSDMSKDVASYALMRGFTKKNMDPSSREESSLIFDWGFFLCFAQSGVPIG